MMASPIYLSIVPLRSMMALVSGVRKRFIRLGEALRIVLVVLGDGGEAAHVAEQNGHAAFFAAQHQLFRRFRQLLDQLRRQVKAEGGADLLALLLLAEIIDEREHQIDQPARDQRIGEIDQQIVRDEEVPRHADEAGDQQRAERDHDRGRQQRRGDDDGEAEDHRGDNLGADRPTRRRQQRLAQNALDDLSVHLDARHHRIEWRGPEIKKTDRRRADQHQLAPDTVADDTAVQDVPGRYVALGIV